MIESQPARILIVDDEAPQMTALCQTLGDKGYSTTGFTSAKEALETLRGQTFDLVLTDLSMPEMDGVSLLRAAKEMDANLVGIVMTGHGTIDTAVEAMKVGALDYILKPFKLSVILPVIARALSIRRLRLENIELENRVRERTAQLEDANKELEAFAYSVSHDLRAPLRSVKAFSEILLEEHSAQLSTEAQGLLNRITTSSRRMEQLIEDLLRLSRIGRQHLSKQAVNVLTLVREVLEELAKENANRNIEIQVNPLPDCVADPSLLRQAFFNLLSNAFKYTRPNQKALVIVDCRRQEGECVYFVRDNGVGFDMKYSQKLFGVFQRLHSQNQFEGTGVGLSIVQRIIHGHGGRIWAEAEPEKGATFYFTLSEKPPLGARA